MEARRCGGPVEVTGTLLARGAEAEVLLVDWFGVRAVAKCRISKGYRHPTLDTVLRKRRTLAEARAIRAALEAGVSAPPVFFVEPESFLIVMEYVEGPPLARLIDEDSTAAVKFVKMLGVEAAKLHGAGIAHGDLTTSNAVASHGRLFLIDFGLSSIKAPWLDMAVDIHLLLRSLESTHPEHVETMLHAFLEGYSSVRGREQAQEMMELVREIRLMGRYRAERRRRGGEVETVWLART